MTYTPTTWVDEIPAETPEKYTITDDDLGEIAASATIALATEPGTPGTAVNATNLNHLEQGLVDIEAATIPAILTAKGDLVVASAADTAAILGVGAAGTYLIPDSGEACGLKWAQMITHGLWTSTNWDGDAKAADTTYTITAESEFGIPANVKMILLNLACGWSTHTDWLTAIYIARPGDIAEEKAFIHLGVMSSYANGAPPYMLRGAGWVPLDENGQFVVRTVTTAPASVILTVMAYLL